MLCALKLQLLPEYVHYGLALLSERTSRLDVA